MEPISLSELEAQLDHIRASPSDDGRVEMIVRRPEPGEREILDEAQLDQVDGLVGDSWLVRGNRHTPDGSAHPDMQLNVMNARVVAALASETERRALAGDQLYVDLDLSSANAPPGTRLAIGSAVIEITEMPHTGCAKFRQRFGKDATKFVNSAAGRELNLRGVCAKVVVPGTIRTGDTVRKVPAPCEVRAEATPND